MDFIVLAALMVIGYFIVISIFNSITPGAGKRNLSFWEEIPPDVKDSILKSMEDRKKTSS